MGSLQVIFLRARLVAFLHNRWTLLIVRTLVQSHNWGKISLINPSENQHLYLIYNLFFVWQTQMASDLRWFNFWFFYFRMVWKLYAFSRNYTLNVEFWYFLRLVICGMILSCDVGQPATAPGQQWDHGDEQQICLPPPCTQAPILYFTFSAVFNKSLEIVNILL